MESHPARTSTSWREVRRDVEQQLRHAAVLSPESEARWLCESVSGHEGAEWDEIARSAPTQRQADSLASLVERRRRGEPLQYVLGAWGFRSLDLMVDRRVLIPRPETEWVVEVALRAVRHARARVLDLGTGSGAIALSIARERPDWEVVATDVSTDALAVARWNGAGNSVRNVEFVLSDWFDGLHAFEPTPREPLSGDQARFDLIVSNPPYIATGERDDLPREVVDHEPDSALFSGDDGLDAIRAIIAACPTWLAPGGAVVVEHAPAQAEAVVALARAAGLGAARTESDLAGRPRMLVARRES